MVSVESPRRRAPYGELQVAVKVRFGESCAKAERGGRDHLIAGTGNLRLHDVSDVEIRADHQAFLENRC